MEEEQQNGQRTNKANGKEEGGEEKLVEASVVGKLVIGSLSGDIPAYEQTGEHATQRQHEVSGQLVAEVHE